MDIRRKLIIFNKYYIYVVHYKTGSIHYFHLPYKDTLIFKLNPDVLLVLLNVCDAKDSSVIIGDIVVRVLDIEIIATARTRLADSRLIQAELTRFDHFHLQL